MKIMGFKQFMENKETQKGTYAGMRFDTPSSKRIKDFMEKHNIPNQISKEKMHVTLLYSRKFLPEYKARGKLTEPIACIPEGFEVWETNGEHSPKTRCLILKLHSPELVERHKRLMFEHGGTFDYPEYKTHVTLSYDIGNMDIKGLNVDGIKCVMMLDVEYQEELNTAWATTN